MSRLYNNSYNVYSAVDVDAIKNSVSTLLNLASPDTAAEVESRPGEYGAREATPLEQPYAGLAYDGPYQPSDPNINHMVDGLAPFNPHDAREAKRDFKMARKSQVIGRPLARAFNAAHDADIAAARAHELFEAELEAAGETPDERATRLGRELLAERGLTRRQCVRNKKVKRANAAAAGVASAISKRARDGLGPPPFVRVAGTTPAPMHNRHFFVVDGIPVNGVLVPEATYRRSRMADVGHRRVTTVGNRAVVDYPPMEQAIDDQFAYVPDFRGKQERSLQTVPVFDPRHLQRTMARERKKARAKAAKAGQEPEAWALAGQTDDEQSDYDSE